MSRIIVNSTSDLLSVSNEETREIPTTVQGSNYTTTSPYLFQWEQLDGTARDLTNVTTIDVIIIYPSESIVSGSGTVTVTGDENNYFEWAADATDTGTSGILYVTFKATFSDGTILYTVPARWIVLDAPGVTAVAGSALTGVTSAEAAMLTTLLSLASDAGNTGYHLVLDGDGTISAEAVASGGFTPLQDPPADADWIDLVIPDTTGDGTGTKMQNSAGVSVYKIDFSNNNQLVNTAPATAKGVILKLAFSMTLGLGNAVNLFIAPKEAIDGGATLTSAAHNFLGHPSAPSSYVETITIPFGDDQTLHFTTNGTPSGGSSGFTLTCGILGWVS